MWILGGAVLLVLLLVLAGDAWQELKQWHKRQLEAAFLAGYNRGTLHQATRAEVRWEEPR